MVSGPISAWSGVCGVSVASPTVQVLRDKLVELWRARELLRQLVAKELKVRYKNSALGFLWSMLTPALMTVVFTAVFTVLFRFRVDDFAAFFLAGYLVWQFFQNASQGSITAIVGNGTLIKKVYFPRELLPLSIVLSQVIHLLLALLAISPYLIWARGWGVVTHLPAIALGVVLVTVFTSGIAMLLAGANVTFRDLQELIVVIFLVWFYATPVIYPRAVLGTLEPDSATGATIRTAAGWVLDLNPMTWFVRLFRESIYGTVVARPARGEGSTQVLAALPQSWPSPALLAGCTASALAVFTVGYVVFHRLAVNFAKEV